MDLVNIWETILLETKPRLNKGLWETNIHTGLLPMTLENDVLTLGTMQDYLINFFEKNPNNPILTTLIETANKVYGKPLTINIINMMNPSERPFSSNPLENTVSIDNNPTVEGKEQSLQEKHILNDENLKNKEDSKTISQFDSSSVYDPPVVLSSNKNKDDNIFSDEKPFGKPDDFYGKPSNEEKPQVIDTTITSSKVSTKEAKVLTESRLNPVYTFDNFITGNTNRIAFAAAQAVGEDPGNRYNPLFIYGQSGLGKTHLMHAIGNMITDKYPHLKVMSITSENFTNIFVNSIKDKDNESFRKTFRTIDVLLIDDIQFLENKNGIQEEFFHTFNTLLDDNKQIVLTSDILPQNMQQMTARLRSRFEAAMIVTIEQPDFETRLAILRYNIEKEQISNPNLHIDDDVITFIAETFDENIRKLQGAFKRLIGQASLENHTQHIDQAYALQLLADLIKDKPTRILSIETIQDFIADYFKIKKSDLLSQKRNTQFAFPRQIAMYLCRELINESYPQIANAFGKKDHTTILHAYDKISKKIEKDLETKRLIDEIKEQITRCS